MFNELLHSFKVSTTDITGAWEDPIETFSMESSFLQKRTKENTSFLPK